MVPERASDLVWPAIAALFSSLQQARVTLPLQPWVIARISIALAGTKAAEPAGNDPIMRGKFLNASAWRSHFFPSRPNGVTIGGKGTKAPVKTLVARDRCSPLTTRRMSRIAKGSYCQGPLF